ncbi:hypothetical protein AB7813_12720 [Tardiphaga sp. 20_F10_N6_6]|uniref:hypothetical protein n=1 Tax=unclassified Tardiphaga TaxID=2631404 RepID=UPI002A5A032A|nr:hypothetical protein [Tardiphaga sp. 42S5]WPO43205.1 hypothetical protein SFY93_08690 [Tardiphaga sp. 42S5]
MASTKKWKEEAQELRVRAKSLAAGAEREGLLRLARQLETASQMSGWLDSPGLQKPG